MLVILFGKELERMNVSITWLWLMAAKIFYNKLDADRIKIKML